MFNLLLALAIGVVIGWTFHAFFSQLNAPYTLNNTIDISSIVKKEPEALKIKIPTQTQKKEFKEIQTFIHYENQKKEPSENSFYTLLEKGFFSDAMALYLDAEPKKIPLYKATLLNYFQRLMLEEPNVSIAYMHEFIDLEPEHNEVALLLIESYKALKKYADAIKLITELLENDSSMEKEQLTLNLIQTSQTYMDELKNSQQFHELITFLEERIEIGIQVPFYSYELAQYYVEIQKYLLATELLKELKFNENYSEKSKNLLLFIEKKLAQNIEYQHKLPLSKSGDHFIVKVTLNDTSLNLLLDTGATLTMINEDKASSLPIINENIILQTAGGDISAQLQEAETLKIGNIELKKFQVVSSSFNQKNADGLLGMNFFKEFKFKIDQDESMLYLSKIEK